MRIRPIKWFLGFGASVAVFAVGLTTSPEASAKPSAAKQTSQQENVIEAGKHLFFDTNLSQPAGMACVSCHSPTAGFSYPESSLNLNMGPVPGVIPGRFGNRKVPTLAYSTYLPTGIPTFDSKLTAYVGGLFFDGRAKSTSDQAEKPFLNPNEMNNVLHDSGDPALVVQKVEHSSYAALFRQAYGDFVFQRPVEQVYGLIADSIAAFEASPEVAPFTSKYDAWLEGKATLTPDELNGLRMVTGRVNGRLTGAAFDFNEHCEECHGIIADAAIGPDLWTFSCYANIGVPRNSRNPYYEMTNPTADPAGYNPLGENYIDFGLGDFMYPLMGLPAGDLADGDPLSIDGTFKTPTLRNVDARPYPSFVKCYMHNGVFKSLKQVVHFYNTRNLTTFPGEIIDFTKSNPYANLKGRPLWPPPEWPSAKTMINPQGASNLKESTTGMENEQIGNMGMTDTMENQIVAFLKTLTDGYFIRN